MSDPHGYTTDASWDGYGVAYPIPVPHVMRWCNRVAQALGRDLRPLLAEMDSQLLPSCTVLMHADRLPLDGAAQRMVLPEGITEAARNAALQGLARLEHTWKQVAASLPDPIDGLDFALSAGVNDRGQPTAPEMAFTYSKQIVNRDWVGQSMRVVEQSCYSVQPEDGFVTALCSGSNIDDPMTRMVRRGQNKYSRSDFWPPDRARAWLRLSGLRVSRPSYFPRDMPLFVELSAPPVKRLRALAHALAELAYHRAPSLPALGMPAANREWVLDLRRRTCDPGYWQSTSRADDWADSLLTHYWGRIDALRARNARHGHGWLLPTDASLNVRFNTDDSRPEEAWVQLAFPNGCCIVRRAGRPQAASRQTQ